MRDHDDCALVRDVLAKAHLRERAPLVVLEGDGRVREEAVSLGVAGENDRHPAEHRVAPVPPLRLDRRAEAVLGEPRVVGLELRHAIIEDGRLDHGGPAGGGGARRRHERRLEGQGRSDDGEHYFSGKRENRMGRVSDGFKTQVKRSLRRSRDGA